MTDATRKALNQVRHLLVEQLVWRQSMRDRERPGSLVRPRLDVGVDAAEKAVTVVDLVLAALETEGPACDGSTAAALRAELEATKARLADLELLARTYLRELDISDQYHGDALDQLADMLMGFGDPEWIGARQKNGQRVPEPELVGRVAARFAAAGLQVETYAWTCVGRVSPDLAVLVDCFSADTDSEGYGPSWATVEGPAGTFAENVWHEDENTVEDNVDAALKWLVTRMFEQEGLEVVERNRLRVQARITPEVDVIIDVGELAWTILRRGAPGRWQRDGVGLARLVADAIEAGRGYARGYHGQDAQHGQERP